MTSDSRPEAGRDAASSFDELATLTARRKRGITQKWAGPFLIVWGLLFASGGVFVALQEQAFTREGVSATALVTEKSLVRGSESDTYRVEYTFFAADGVAYAGTAGLQAGQWQATSIGDPIEIVYIASDPGRTKLAGGPPVFLLALILLIPGAIGVLAGAVMTNRRIRGRAVETRPVDDLDIIAAAGERPPGEPDRTTYRYRRPAYRVVLDLLGPPLIAVAFLGVAFLFLNGTIKPNDIVASVLGPLFFGLFGVLLALATITNLRRGFSRTLLEVGPDGVWTPEMGRLGWASIAEVRLERPGVRRVGRRSGSGYLRLGILPVAGAGVRPGWSARASAALIDRVTRLTSRGQAELSDAAPFGISAYEIGVPLTEVIGRFRAYVAVVDRASSSAGAASEPMAPVASVGPPARPGHELSVADVRAIDAALGSPRPTAAPAVATTPAPAVPSATYPESLVAVASRPQVDRTFSPPTGLLSGRPLGRLSDLADLGWSAFFAVLIMFAFGTMSAAFARSAPWIGLIFLVVMLPVALWAILTILQLPSRLGRVFGDQDSLAVGPSGIWLPEMGRVAWDRVSEVRLRPIDTSSDDDNHDPASRWRISVLPSDPSVLDERRWSLRTRDRLRAAIGGLVPFLRSWTLPTGFSVDSDRLDAPIDVVVDLIGLYHPIVGSTD
jgi:hypothetical protein